MSAVNHGNVLSATNVTHIMIFSLPKTSDSQLRNPYDAIALLCHACMLAVGFRLVGLGEDHKIEATSEAEDAKPLPPEWNATTTSDYAFRYSHTQSSLEYLIKISRLGKKAVINGLGIGDDKVHSFNFHTKDYISDSSLPFTLSGSDTADIDRTAQSLQSTFISIGRITDLSSLLRLNIIQKLAPGLQKEGYEDSAYAVSQSSSTNRPQREPAPGRESDPATHDPLRDGPLPPFAQPRPFDDPLAAAPRRRYPPGEFPPPDFEDEYEINRPRGAPGLGRRPLNIGERDLYPPGLGPNDPFGMPGYGPMGGGGMHPTLDDPIFGGRGSGRGSRRFRWDDPLGPGDDMPGQGGNPGFPRGGFGGGGLGGGGGGNPFPW